MKFNNLVALFNKSCVNFKVAVDNTAIKIFNHTVQVASQTATIVVPKLDKILEQSASNIGYAIGYTKVKAGVVAENTIQNTANFITNNKRRVAAVSLAALSSVAVINHFTNNDDTKKTATIPTTTSTFADTNEQISEAAIARLVGAYNEKQSRKFAYNYGKKSRGYSPHVANNIEKLLDHPELVQNGLEKFQRLSVDEAFNLAVMQESGGNQFDANGRVMRSSAGAIGIAQVIPETARGIAPSCTGAPLDVYRYYNDASYNEKLGRCYFHKQYDTFGGDNVKAALAYSSGPGSDKIVNGAIKGLKGKIAKFGDPSKGEISWVNFIKKIPNTENRHYALHIMARGGLIDTSVILPTRKKTRDVSYQFNDHSNNIAPETAPEITPEAQQTITTAAAEPHGLVATL